MRIINSSAERSSASVWWWKRQGLMATARLQWKEQKTAEQLKMHLKLFLPSPVSPFFSRHWRKKALHNINKARQNKTGSSQSFLHVCVCVFLILHFIHVCASEARHGLFSMGINHNEMVLRSCSKDERRRIKDV